MFTTPADAGNFDWADGVATSAHMSTTNTTDDNSGLGNSRTLNLSDSNSNVVGVQPHLAAQECAELTDHNRSDWHLPAINELQILYDNRGAIGGFVTNNYWSSTETSRTTAHSLNFNSGDVQSNTKAFDLPVRCVRKSNSTLDRGLVGYWTFDDIDGTTVPDNSGNGNDGTMVNEPERVDGVIGGGMTFRDGPDADDAPYVDIGDQSSLDITGDISIAAWINIPGAGGRTIFSKWEHSPKNIGYFLFQESTRLAFQINGLGGARVSVASAPYWNKWTHIVAVKEGTEPMRLYLDGKEPSSYSEQGVGAPIVAPTGQSAQIGHRDDNQHDSWVLDGSVDEVRIYNRALAPSEISMLYKMGRTEPACSQPDGKLGDLAYHGDAFVMMYCNGHEWVAMGPVPGSGAGECSQPDSAVVGKMAYHADDNVMMYCDGAIWRAIGKLPAP